MAQIYMIEFLVNAVKVFNKIKTFEIEDKKLVITIGFGPKTEFIVRERDLNLKPHDDWKKDKHTHNRMWVRQLKAGKSFMFPSFPDTLMQVFRKFPLEITIWDEDASESDKKIFVGTGYSIWNQHYYEWLANTADPKTRIEPLTVNEEIQLMDDCCCVSVGYVDLIIRMSAMGAHLISTFEKRQTKNNTDTNVFVFKTSLSSQLYEGKQLDCDSFCMIGPLYETVTLKKPEKHHASKEDSKSKKSKSNSVLGLLTNLFSSSKASASLQNKIKLGDIKGMCGYSMCPMAQKIRLFLENIDKYKTNIDNENRNTSSGQNESYECLGVCSGKKILGDVIYPEFGDLDATESAKPGVTFSDYGGPTKKPDKNYVPYPRCVEGPLSRDCTCQKEEYTNLCKANDCECKEESVRKESRKVHKPFCPSYSHKKTCPISLVATEEEPAELTKDEAEDKKKMAASPYHVPPVRLRPCPAPGKPCQPATNETHSKDRKHGISKVGSKQPDIPLVKQEQSRCRPKISCTGEYERIKKFLNDYMEEYKINNSICIDRRSLPGVRKCCDKFSQIGGDLTRKNCCTAHKMMLKTSQ